MSMRCPSCGFESADGAQWCDFCKEPFAKKPASAPAAAEPAKPAAPAADDPLAGLTKEQLLDLPAEQLLKDAEPGLPAVPPWVRPLAYAFALLGVVGGGLILLMMYSRLRGMEQNARPRSDEPPAAEAPQIP